MSNLAKLKKKAAEFEQKRQFDRALATYEDVLRAQEGSEDADVSLYNRVGDLQLRLGRTTDALNSYERAVDLYAERGFLNNAIALCNKILRQSPGAAHIHYKLGRVNALKGFKSDARQHFVTYAELMQRGGRLDEAFVALKDFADLSSGQEDLRLLLADQFARHDRRDEAMAQLQIVLDRFQADRRHAEAEIVRERMRALDPDYVASQEPDGDDGFEERRSGGYANQTRTSGGSAMPELVLIDPTEYGNRAAGAAGRASREAPAPAAPLDDPAGPALSRPSGAVAMPDSLIRGADSVLAGDQTPPSDDAFAARPYGVADLDRGTAGTGEGTLADLDLSHGVDAGAAADAPVERLELDDPLGVGEDASASAGLDDSLLIVDLPEDDTSATRPSPAGGVESGAFDGALAEGWEVDSPAAAAGRQSGDVEMVDLGAEHDAAATADARADDSLSIVMPQARDGADNAIAAFDSWLASPGSIAARRSVETPAARPADVGAESGAEPVAAEAEAPELSIVEPESATPADPTAARPAAVRPVTPVPLPTPRSTMPQSVAVRPEPKTPVSTRPVAEPEPAAAEGGFFNLGDWLRDEEAPRSTRMVVEERAPSGDEEADFAAMLRKFKQGVAENVEETDYDSHYDLGVAYKEMGLTEEAIAEFQKALRGTDRRGRTYEALGQCFLDLGQPAVATSLLTRATQEPGMDDQQLVGVLYLLGRAAETMQQPADAVRYYERVLAVDITFSDVSDRIAALEQVVR